MAVQWHPEALTGDHPQFVELFRALTRACPEKGQVGTPVMAELANWSEL